MFRAYLKVADDCPVCGEELIHQRADDAPAYLTMLIVGHFIVAGVLAEDELFPTSTWRWSAFCGRSSRSRPRCCCCRA